MKIAFYGSSLVLSAYFRGIRRYLAELHHHITFHEPRAEGGVDRDADVVIEVSGTGALARGRPHQLVIFWDVDAPATLDRLTRNPSDPLRCLVPEYDLIFTYGGGDPVVTRYRSFGARECIPIYNALDPATHHPVAPRREFEADLAFLGDRLPDREARAGEYFFRAASCLPDAQFLLAGSGWDGKPMPPPVRYLGHLPAEDRNAFHCTPRAVLHISRESMAANGWSPAPRLFEAAGAAACLITDPWEGIESFLEPESEVLIAHDGEEVAGIVRDLDPKRAAAIGKAALRRVLAQNTYAHRAAQLDQILFSHAGGGRLPKAG